MTTPTSTPPVRGRLLALASILAMALFPMALSAQDYTWATSSNAQTWSNAANWSTALPGGVPIGGPDGSGIFVRMALNTPSNRDVYLFNTGDDGDNVKTVGRLDFGDTNGTDRFRIYAGTGSGVLEFNGGASNAQLNTTSTSFNDQIHAPLRMATNLDMSYGGASGLLTMYGGISSSATSGQQILAIKDGTVRFESSITNGSTGGSIGVLVDGGRLELYSSASNYTGDTVVRAGTLATRQNAFNNTNGGLGNSSSAIILADSLSATDANVSLQLIVAGIGIGRDILVNNYNSAGTTSIGGAVNGNTYSGTITIHKGVTLRADTSGVVNFTKAIVSGSGTNTVTIASNNTGTVELKNGTLTDQFGGAAYDVTSGTLRLGASDQIANSSNLLVSGGAFNIQNFSETVDEVVLNSGSITGTSGLLTASTFELKEGTVTAKLDGAGATLAKTGAGTVILSSISTYTGATTVSDGVLVIGEGGSIASSSLVTVSGSGVLGGTGTVGAVQLTGGGTLAAGLSPGIMNTGDLEVGAGSHLAFELGKVGLLPEAGADYDQVNVTGGVTFTGADLALTLGDGIADGDIFYILANDGADVLGGDGMFASLNGVATPLGQDAVFSVSGQYFQISYSANWSGDESTSEFSGAGNDIALMAVPVPESSVAVLVLACLAGSALARRSRRK